MLVSGVCVTLLVGRVPVSVPSFLGQDLTSVPETINFVLMSQHYSDTQLDNALDSSFGPSFFRCEKPKTYIYPQIYIFGIDANVG